jgi:hypothetical protein
MPVLWKEIDASISNFLFGGYFVEVGYHSFTLRETCLPVDGEAVVLSIPLA